MTLPRGDSRQSARSLVLGGLLPVIAYTVVEETAGLFWGLIAGMILAVGEMIWEWRTKGRVDAITWGSAGFILVLGGVSLLTQEGIWFKLQPAILSFVFAAACWGSVALKKPLLVVLAKKQGAFERVREELKPRLVQAFGGLTFRVGIFFAIHGGLGVWAAYAWSTRHWALLKGLGVTIGFAFYLLIEVLILRWRLRRLPSPNAN